MPNEEYTTLDDLVFSHSFRHWVLQGNGSEAEFWTNWAGRNPNREKLVNDAKEIILALQVNPIPVPGEGNNGGANNAGAIEAEVEKTLQKLRDGRLNMVREIPFRPSLLGRRISRYWVIAAVLAAIAIGIILKSHR